MLDHVSVPVRDLAASTRFYETVLAALGYARMMEKPGTIGFGKKYPDFWLNERPEMRDGPNSGSHVCFRTADKDNVDRFHAAALAAGGRSAGAPGLRPQYHETYYAAFIIDPDGNRIEAVTFLRPQA
jgi:catechol 2,3-dioxygenase-like lactoylglutathione lyase family enzyme